jgi:archaeosortase A (PGF-CTERM-specific)
MSDLLVLCAFISSAVFLIARQPYAAVAGWAFVAANLWSELPAFFMENNFLYPALALLSLPFLAVTAERLVRKDPALLQLSRTASIATVIYVPFSLVPYLHDTLISVVVTLAFALITALGHSPQMVSWDVIYENAFANKIILGCTGIMAIAMMLGVVFGEKSLTVRQAVLSFLLVVPAIFLLNLLRVAVVFIAVSDRWFAGFPDPTGTGDANFFWAHNVIAEGLAVLFLVVLVWVLVRIIPRLGTLARALAGVYRDRLRQLVVLARDTL